jgi:glutathione S-transferase
MLHAMSDPIILYADAHWDSPYVFTVFVALSEKRLPFITQPLDLDRGEQRTPEYRRKSLTSRVPGIEHDGFTLSESLAIVEYLEERFRPPEYRALLPAGLHERSRARQLLGWLRSDLLALRDERPTTTMFGARATGALSDRARSAADKLVSVAEALVPAGEGDLFGALSIADADLAFMLHRLILNGDAVPERVVRYAARQWQRPSIQSFIAHAHAARKS